MLSDEQAEPECTATPAAVEADQHRLGLDAVHARGRPGGAAVRPARRARRPRPRRRRAPPARRRAIWRRAVAASVSSGRRRRGQGGGGGAEREQRGDRLQPAAAAPLLLAADEQRLEPAAAPDDQRAGARAPRRACGALTLTRSASSAPRSVGTWPQAAAASTCTVTPASRHSATTSWTGWRVPTSWLAHWQCTSAGRGSERAAGARAGRRRRGGRSPSTASTSIGAARAEASRTAECSTAAQSTGAPGAARVAPQTAALIASVPPEVKTTWRGRDAEQLGHLRRAPPRARRGRCGPPRGAGPGRRAGAWPSRASAATASGRGGVVLAWSR